MAGTVSILMKTYIGSIETTELMGTQASYFIAGVRGRYLVSSFLSRSPKWAQQSFLKVL